MNRLIGSQLDLFGGPPSDVWSSGRPPKAAKALQSRVGRRETHRQLILERLRLVGPGSPSEIASDLRITHRQAGRRLGELERDGLVRRLPEAVRGPRGRFQARWEALTIDVEVE